jgi:hypothetical protein
MSITFQKTSIGRIYAQQMCSKQHMCNKGATTTHVRIEKPTTTHAQ